MTLTSEQRARVVDFVAALRSGRYEQAIQQLGRVDDDVKSYCCEGVAAERYASDVGYASLWDEDTLILRDADDNESHDYADDEFWDALGLGVDEEDGNSTSTKFALVLPPGQDVRNTGSRSVSFMALNDEGFTFAQIADLIEWQFLTCLDAAS